MTWRGLNIRRKAIWLVMKAVIGVCMLLILFSPVSALSRDKVSSNFIGGKGGAHFFRASSDEASKGAHAGRNATIEGAENPDFITVSLVTASPEREVYSVFGHTAIRMQCPTAGLDYCFSFAMATGIGGYIAFFSGKAAGAFQCEPTKEYLEAYRKEGRGVREDTLNLSPKEKQELWRKLDEELTSGVRRHFNLLQNNCTSMAIIKIESVLKEKYIDFGKMPPPMYYKNGKGIMWASRRSPWAQWLFMTFVGSEADTEWPDENQLSPELLISILRGAVIRPMNSAEGSPVPVIVGSTRQLLVKKTEYKASALGPVDFFGGLLAVAIVWAVGRALYLRKKTGGGCFRATEISEANRKATTPNKIIPTAPRAPLFPYIYKVIGWGIDIAYIAASVILLYVTLVSGLFGLHWNWLLLVFNPVPPLLWLCLRRKPYYNKVYALYAVWLAAFVAFVPWITEQLLPAHYLLVAAMAVICADYYLAGRRKSAPAESFPRKIISNQSKS